MEESAGVREAMLRYYDRASAGDAASFDQLVSREQASMIIGTAPNEWHGDRDGWKAAFPPQGLRVGAGDLRAYEEGSVGWLADQPSFVLPDGTAVRTRATAVMRREDGGWKLVQAHVSIAVPDEQAVELGREH